MEGTPSTYELWDLFWKHEKVASDMGRSAEHKLASATMANAIARIIAIREERDGY